MEPTFATSTEPHRTLYTGEAFAVLAELPSESVDCVVTSPPYWGLRDYGMSGQLGLEDSPEQYVEALVKVCRELRRVLKKTGSLWLNLGDSYSGSGKGDYGEPRKQTTNHGTVFQSALQGAVPDGTKPKDLVGIPWLVAFALRADGWFLRADIIWAKANPMPESMTDRPTRSHEYVFLLTKSATYYFDQEAIREPTGGNRRDVWTINTEGYEGAHFATFPEELPSLCIRAGSSSQGVCAECGNPWRRWTGRECGVCGHLIHNQAKECDSCGYRNTDWRDERTTSEDHRSDDFSKPGLRVPRRSDLSPKRVVSSWSLDCGHEGETRRSVVLDPFAGSGTTMAVARDLGRDSIGIELNPEYATLITLRCAQEVFTWA